MDWVDFGYRFGLPALLLGAVTVFLYKEAWPFLKNIVESERSARTKEHENFIASLERRDEQAQRMLGALDKLADAVENIRQEKRRK